MGLRLLDLGRGRGKIFNVVFFFFSYSFFPPFLSLFSLSFLFFFLNFSLTAFFCFHSSPEFLACLFIDWDSSGSSLPPLLPPLYFPSFFFFSSIQTNIPLPYFCHTVSQKVSDL